MAEHESKQGKNLTTEEKDIKKIELETAIKENRAVPLRMDREITEGESMHMMMQRMFGVDCHQMWRIKGKGTHDFKYIGIDDSGKVVEPNGSTSREGSNPNQKVIVMKKDGTFVEKTVDHMIIKGRFAIYTDIPDGELSDRTAIGIAIRGPGERYLAIEGLDSRNNEASNDSIIKESMTRAKSIYEVDDVARASKLAEKVSSLNWDGKITAEEVELVKKLTQEGIPENGIVSILNFVHELKELGLNNTQIKAIIDTADSITEQIEELERNNISNKEEAKEIFRMMSEGIEIKEALRALEEGKTGVGGDTEGKVKVENGTREERVDEDDDFGPWSKRGIRR